MANHSFLNYNVTTMKKTTIILQAVLFLSTSLCAQQTPRQYSFDAHAKYYAEAFDVKWTMPKKMTDLNICTEMSFRKGYHLLYTGCPVLQSEDKQCILRYRFKPHFISEERAKMLYPEKLNNDNVHRNLISYELGTIYGYIDKNVRVIPGKTFPFDEYVSVLPRRIARGWFNADSVFVYNLPVDTPYKGTFKHCTGIIITKKDRTGFVLKFYLTDEGKKNEKQYLRSLRKKIWYNNPKWEYDKEVEQQAAHRYLYSSESE